MQVAPPALLATAQVNCCIFSSLELLAHSLTEVSPLFISIPSLDSIHQLSLAGLSNLLGSWCSPPASQLPSDLHEKLYPL